MIEVEGSKLPIVENRTETKLSADLKYCQTKKWLILMHNLNTEGRILVCVYLATAENSTDGKPFSTDALPWEYILLSAMMITLFLFIEIRKEREDTRVQMRCREPLQSGATRNATITKMLSSRCVQHTPASLTSMHCIAKSMLRYKTHTFVLSVDGIIV